LAHFRAPPDNGDTGTRLSNIMAAGGGIDAVDTLVFDLDGTLYAIENGYEHACRDRVFEFMVQKLGVASVGAAKELWWEHFQVYNQTYRSLRWGGTASSQHRQRNFDDLSSQSNAPKFSVTHPFISLHLTNGRQAIPWSPA